MLIFAKATTQTTTSTTPTRTTTATTPVMDLDLNSVLRGLQATLGNSGEESTSTSKLKTNDFLDLELRKMKRQDFGVNHRRIKRMDQLMESFRYICFRRTSALIPDRFRRRRRWFARQCLYNYYVMDSLWHFKIPYQDHFYDILAGPCGRTQLGEFIHCFNAGRDHILVNILNLKLGTLLTLRTEFAMSCLGVEQRQSIRHCPKLNAIVAPILEGMQEICSSQGEVVATSNLMEKFEDAILRDNVDEPVLNLCFETVTLNNYRRFLDYYHRRMANVTSSTVAATTKETMNPPQIPNPRVVESGGKGVSHRFKKKKQMPKNRSNESFKTSFRISKLRGEYKERNIGLNTRNNFVWRPMRRNNNKNKNNNSRGQTKHTNHNGAKMVTNRSRFGATTDFGISAKKLGENVAAKGPHKSVNNRKNVTEQNVPSGGVKKTNGNINIITDSTNIAKKQPITKKTIIEKLNESKSKITTHDIHMTITTRTLGTKTATPTPLPTKTNGRGNSWLETPTTLSWWEDTDYYEEDYEDYEVTSPAPWWEKIETRSTARSAWLIKAITERPRKRATVIRTTKGPTTTKKPPRKIETKVSTSRRPWWLEPVTTSTTLGPYAFKVVDEHGNEHVLPDGYR